MSIPAITPYPMPGHDQQPENRVNWQLDPQRAVLLVHDMQEYFLNKYFQDQAPIPALKNHIAQLLSVARAQGIPVFYTAQPTDQPDEDRALLNDMWGPGIPAHPEQYPIVAELAPQEQETVLTKWRYSAFQRSDFREQLRQLGRDQLVITGVYAHIGCMTTALDAFMEDVQPFLVNDAVADFSLEEHLMASRYVAKRCGVSLSTATAIAALGGQQQQDVAGFSVADLDKEVERLLEEPIDELPSDENVMLLGMDSIRLMSLAERLRSAGINASFADLAERPTLDEWRALVRAGGVQ
ncbi:isochorismatase family protein [Carnimonas bestiolae]|uniref:isochorismatase family protein n=1 Tax=Carnimonas bestiolae TaxID=3402172 RepID=UPI003EDBFF3C